MRNPSTEFFNGLFDAPTKGIVPRRFISVAAKDRTTGELTPQPYSFWTGDEDLVFTVRDGQTNELVARTYYGLGITLSVPTIPRVSKLEKQTIQVKLPSTHPVVIDMVRSKTVRFCKVDIHEALLSPVSRKTLGNPEIIMLGEVDRDPINRPEAGGSGSIVLEVVSDAINGLTRTNPATRSHQRQLQISGDQFGKYGNAVEHVQITWGE